MIANAYAAVMNPEVNPLRQLPKMVRFQIMTSLALMWSIVFALWTGMIMWVGPSVVRIEFKELQIASNVSL